SWRTGHFFGCAPQLRNIKGAPCYNNQQQYPSPCGNRGRGLGSGRFPEGLICPPISIKQNRYFAIQYIIILQPVNVNAAPVAYFKWNGSYALMADSVRGYNLKLVRSVFKLSGVKLKANGWPIRDDGLIITIKVNPDKILVFFTHYDCSLVVQVLKFFV